MNVSLLIILVSKSTFFLYQIRKISSTVQTAHTEKKYWILAHKNWMDFEWTDFGASSPELTALNSFIWSFALFKQQNTDSLKLWLTL